MDKILAFFEKISGALMSFNFTSDLLDIILVTFVIYEVIRIIRGTRTFQLIKGLVFLGVVYFIVESFDMEASGYLLTTLIENGLIILVVLFSPEIRKFLERFGRQSLKNVSFFNFRSDEEQEKVVTDTINEFCKAVSDMSETKTGALVVFEKDAPLTEISETGTIVDSRASTELFNSLFFKNSALHDGAVIVREGRIFSAGCILPLTQSMGIGSELGTRHRAAIGISEQCDAVSVVVSEETGGISVTKNGKITRDVTTAKLREILLDELLKSNSGEKQSKRNKKKAKKEGDKVEK